MHAVYSRVLITLVRDWLLVWVSRNDMARRGRAACNLAIFYGLWRHRVLCHRYRLLVIVERCLVPNQRSLPSRLWWICTLLRVQSLKWRKIRVNKISKATYVLFGERALCLKMFFLISCFGTSFLSNRTWFVHWCSIIIVLRRLPLVTRKIRGQMSLQT